MILCFNRANSGAFANPVFIFLPVLMSVALSNITIAERWGDQPRRDRVLAILKVWDAASPHGTRPVPGMPTVKVQR